MSSALRHDAGCSAFKQISWASWFSPTVLPADPRSAIAHGSTMPRPVCVITVSDRNQPFPSSSQSGWMSDIEVHTAGTSPPIGRRGLSDHELRRTGQRAGT